MTNNSTFNTSQRNRNNQNNQNQWRNNPQKYTNHRNNNRGNSYNDKENPLNPYKMNLEPMEIPDNYLQEAEDIMKTQSKKITTSKLRAFLSLVSKVYNMESVRTEETLLPESIDTIKMMRIRIVYEAGRDDSREKNMLNFLDQSHIVNYIKGIGESRSKFIKFARYMEALVAYHKFYGGRD